MTHQPELLPARVGATPVLSCMEALLRCSTSGHAQPEGEAVRSASQLHLYYATNENKTAMEMEQIGKCISGILPWQPVTRNIVFQHVRVLEPVTAERCF